MSVEEVNQTMQRWSGDSLRRVLEVQTRPLVSRDIVGNSHSAILSPQDTYVQGDRLVKVLAWYDNEWGFSSRLKDMIQLMARIPAAA